MNMKKTQKKLLKRLGEIEKVCPITNDRKLLKALEKITDEEISSGKPDLDLIDETVKFSLCIKGYDENKIENEAENAKIRFYDRIRDSEIVYFAKKRLSRASNLAIVIAAIVALTVGAFAASISFGIADIDGHVFKALQKNKVYEDEKHTVMLSDDMFVYYDSVEEMMEEEGLQSVYLPGDVTEQIRAATIYYNSELKNRIIMIKTHDLWLYITLDSVSLPQNFASEKVGNFDIIFF